MPGLNTFLLVVAAIFPVVNLLIGVGSRRRSAR
jgi:hypothetical protein